MPNDCQNKLIIKGTKEQLKKFLDTYISIKASGHYLDFNKIIPEPLTSEECDPQYVIAPNEDRRLIFADDRTWFDWYGWRLQYWNTKWNSYENTIFFASETELKIYFETAWDPCLPVITKLFELHPELTFRYSYYEFGNQFGGIIDKNGHTEVQQMFLNDFAEKEGFECGKF